MPPTKCRRNQNSDSSVLCNVFLLIILRKHDKFSIFADDFWERCTLYYFPWFWLGTRSRLVFVYNVFLSLHINNYSHFFSVTMRCLLSFQRRSYLALSLVLFLLLPIIALHASAPTWKRFGALRQARHLVWSPKNWTKKNRNQVERRVELASRFVMRWAW